jgi:predicted transcriptional regulator
LTTPNIGVILGVIKPTKTIILEKELADRIQELADGERRSFAREAQVLLEAALERQKRPGPTETGEEENC